MKLILKSRNNLHYAEANYKDGVITILKGSRINLKDSFPKMASDVFTARHNRRLVDKKGVTLQDITFTSPSTAGQFVTGRSVNGNIAWRPDDLMPLRSFLGKMKSNSKRETKRTKK